MRLQSMSSHGTGRRVLSLAVALTVAIGVASVSAPTLMAAGPPQGWVDTGNLTVYKDANLNGNYMTLEVYCLYNVGSPCYFTRLGARAYVDNLSTVTGPCGGTWNDCISSATMYNNGALTGAFCVLLSNNSYGGGNGQLWTLSPGQWRGSGQVQYNDQISSIEVSTSICGG